MHFLVEAEAGIRLGVYGRPAAGDNGLFWPADPAERAKAARRRKSKPVKPSPRAQADMARSEHLAGIAVPVWEVRRGHAQELPAYVTAAEIPAWSTGSCPGSTTTSTAGTRCRSGVR
ncbi:hypothetical protein [Streptomyces hirsutus]|uniref:hypothetical protein n=1 Tax=Streptomyces hirsutus TaxID=35620 RepID=UPI00369FB60D